MQNSLSMLVSVVREVDLGKFHWIQAETSDFILLVRLESHLS